MKKIQLSDARRDYLKSHYGRVQPKTEDERKYLNKIKAGKARAKNALTDKGGRYVTATLKDEVIKNLAASKGVSVKTSKNRAKQIEAIKTEAKISDRELKRFFEINRDTYQKIIETGSLKEVTRNSQQIENDIRKYRGKIIIEQGGISKQVSKDAAIKAIAELKQYLTANLSVVEIMLKPEIFFDGKMKIKIPDPHDLYQKVKTDLDAANKNEVREAIEEMDLADYSEMLQDYIDDEVGEDEIIIIASPKKGK